jgi:hypothetical protein
MKMKPLLLLFSLIVVFGCEPKFAITGANFSVDSEGKTLFGGSRRFEFKRFRTKEEGVEDSKTQIGFLQDLNLRVIDYQLKPQEAEKGVVILEGNLTVINVVRPNRVDVQVDKLKLIRVPANEGPNGPDKRYEWRIAPEDNKRVRKLAIEQLMNQN